MSLESSIFSALSDAASDTAALVGSGDACRVYPGNAPAGTALPYAVYNMISSVATPTHNNTSDLDRAEVQFSCIASTRAAASEIRRAIRSDLTDQVLAGGERPVDFSELDGYSDAVDAHVQILLVTIWHNPLSA